MRHFFIALFFISTYLEAISLEKLQSVLLTLKSPFEYPLDITVLAGADPDSDVILCCHGYGLNSSFIQEIQVGGIVKEHLIGFNFPDYNITYQHDHSNIKFGTINELLPALHLMKLLVVDGGLHSLTLYGFSAGGAAAVNLIGVLNTSDYDAELERINITAADKKLLLDALKKGVVLLDAPLKSVEEAIIHRPYVSSDHIMVLNYLNSGMRPIDALKKWSGLSLALILFFQDPDMTINNRDDQLFITQLLKYNPNGYNQIIIKDEGGHRSFHRSLWEAYNQLKLRQQAETIGV